MNRNHFCDAPHAVVAVQDGSKDRSWLWVPYNCYYHLYSRDDTYTCAKKTGVDWILTMGDSQEREFIAQLKMMNGTVQDTTKFEDADFVMHESPNNLRVTWQFYTSAFMWVDAFGNQRSFALDQKYYDHFNIRPSEVRACFACEVYVFVLFWYFYICCYE